jgi:F-box and WD-40 domain protein CDC4
VGLLGLSPSSLVSAAADSTLRIWDPATGQLRHALSGHTGAITCFQHDEFKVLSGSDGTLKMWDVRDGQPVRDLLTGVVGVWQVVFEGRWCVAASNRNEQTMLDVWDFGAEHDDEDGDGWVGETPSGLYDEESGAEDEYEDEEEEAPAPVQRADRPVRGPNSAASRPVDSMDQDEEDAVPPVEPEPEEDGEEELPAAATADVVPVDEDEEDDGEDGPPADWWLRSRMDTEDAPSTGATSSSSVSVSVLVPPPRGSKAPRRGATEEPTPTAPALAPGAAPVSRAGPSTLRALPPTETPTRQRTSRTVPPRRK